LEAILVDGNDADVMHEIASRTIARARAGEGPSLIEALTYRHGGHSRGDPASYRPKEEVREWMDRDPIVKYRERLKAAGLDEATLRKIDDDAQRKVDFATDEARKAPAARVEDIESQVWSDGGSSWRN
jgi:pyruvate dehydrogenase E1 component alpha subunit